MAKKEDVDLVQGQLGARGHTEAGDTWGGAEAVPMGSLSGSNGAGFSIQVPLAVDVWRVFFRALQPKC